MKCFRIIFSLVMILMVSTPSFAKKKKEKVEKEKVEATTKSKNTKPVYAFGVATAFGDSTAYFTEIQVLDSVYLEKKSFLPERASYSYQMKNYLEYQKGLKNRVCTIFFSVNKNNLTKEYNKVMNRYKKQVDKKVVFLKEDEFMFTKPEY